MESELATIKRKIRAMSEMTLNNGCTESEAMLAMKKIGDLLTQYNLTMNEVTMREEPCVTKTFCTGLKKRNVLWHVFSGLQRFCGVKVWFSPANRWSSNNDGIVWSFFGLESDVSMALYLADILNKAERAALAEFQRTPVYKGFEGHRIVVTGNFKSGFGSRLNERLHLLTRERVEAERAQADFHAKAMAARMIEATVEAQVSAAQAKTGTALICLAKERMIEEEFAKRGPKLRTQRATSKARYNSDARNAGRNAGDKVNLGRPLAGTAKPSGYLT